MKRKGFTLIELLAVIVILAVIAIIVTPMIMGTIKSSRENAVKASANNYFSAVEEYIALEAIKNPNYSFPNNTLLNISIFSKVEISGTAPTSGVIGLDNGKVDSAIIVIGDHTVTKKAGSDDLIVTPNNSNNLAISYPITIWNLVQKEYPELELADGGGCKNPSEINYTYLGGCYLKGRPNAVKEFYNHNLEEYSTAGITSDILDSLFVNGSFSIDKYNEIILPIIAKEYGTTVEQLNEEAKEEGYDTYFRYNNHYSPDVLNLPRRDNNYVWYSGFVWRIMGINMDGSIRMISEENITSLLWGSSKSYEEGYIKKWLNGYFINHLKDSSILAQTSYCKDADSKDWDTKRIVCDNGANISSIATILSLDEFNLSKDSSYGTYLNNDQWFFTLTREDWSDIWYVMGSVTNPLLDYDSISGVRPIISVLPTSLITSGDGTLSENSSGYILNQTLDDVKNKKISEVVSSGDYVNYDSHKYRVVEKNNFGVELILDGFYTSNYAYGDTFDSIIGNLLKSSEFKNWLLPTKSSIKTTWYRGNTNYWLKDYEADLSSEVNPFNNPNGIGLIKIGEMLANQSLSLYTKNYTIANKYESTNWYWTLTPYGTTEATFVGEYGEAKGTEPYFFHKRTDSGGIRPVIVIPLDSIISYGNGTLKSPFNIE